MEYAAGGELFARICNAGRFNEDEVRMILTPDPAISLGSNELCIFHLIFPSGLPTSMDHVNVMVDYYFIMNVKGILPNPTKERGNKDLTIINTCYNTTHCCDPTNGV